MTWRKAGLMMLGVLVAALAAHKILEFIQVDRCLDAGGAWDHTARKCVTQKPAAAASTDAAGAVR